MTYTQEQATQMLRECWFSTDSLDECITAFANLAAERAVAEYKRRKFEDAATEGAKE
jgi:hypothetical protein